VVSDVVRNVLDSTIGKEFEKTTLLSRLLMREIIIKTALK
jgi:hypothetical protein